MTSRVAKPVSLGAALGLACGAIWLTWEIVTPRLPVRFEAAASPMWMPRLAMAAAAAVGIAAVFVALARLVDRRAGAYAATILATTPVWFLHGRTSTGAIVPLAAEALLLAALAIAVLDDAASRRARAGWLAIAGVVVGACALSIASGRSAAEDGALAVPSTALGALARSAALASAGLASGGGLAAILAPPAIAVGAVALLSPSARRRLALGVLGLGVALAGAAAVIVTTKTDGLLATIVAGARAATPGAAKGFEAPVAAIAYGFLPWTPLVPLAIARRVARPGERALVLAAALAIGAHALLAPRGAGAVFVGAAPIACAVALALRALEDAKRPSVVLVAIVIATGILVAHDVELAPDRVTGAIGARDLAIAPAQLASIARTARSATWLAVTLSTFALVLPRSWLPTGRGLAILAAGALAGLVLRAYAYPSLLARLSPGEAFEAYAARKHPGDALGALGVDPRALAAAGSAPIQHASASAAAQWLLDDPAPRRFLVLAAGELPRVNATYRATRGDNVPVLAGASGSILLAASALAPGESSESPLDRIVLHEPPRALRPFGAKLGDYTPSVASLPRTDRLEALGWELTDDRGKPLDAARSGKKAHVRVAVRVGGGEGAAPLSAYCTFLHVDHTPVRFSAEHKEHAYPMALWREGDVVIDDFEVTLAPQFGAGRYALYWGVGVLPCEDDKRMPIGSGPSDGHGRAFGGSLEVR